MNHECISTLRHLENVHLEGEGGVNITKDGEQGQVVTHQTTKHHAQTQNNYFGKEERQQCLYSCTQPTLFRRQILLKVYFKVFKKSMLTISISVT